MKDESVRFILHPSSFILPAGPWASHQVTGYATLMPAITNKQRQLTQLFTTLKKGHDVPDYGALPVLEQFLYGICREGATRDLADRAFQNLREQFFDWN